jgi:hypothetical protein
MHNLIHLYIYIYHIYTFIIDIFTTLQSTSREKKNQVYLYKPVKNIEAGNCMK